MALAGEGLEIFEPVSSATANLTTIKSSASPILERWVRRNLAEQRLSQLWTLPQIHQAISNQGDPEDWAQSSNLGRYLSLVGENENGLWMLKTRALVGAVEPPESRESLVEPLESGLPEPFGGLVRGMQKWEGRVTAVEGEYFTAELTPLTDDGPVLYADFATELLEPDSVVPGDVVYVTVRTVKLDGGYGVTRTSSVRLRRLGVWSADEVAAINERGRQRFEEIADYID